MLFTTRAASMSDAAAISELLTRCRWRHLGRESPPAEAIEHLSEPGTDPRLDTAVATGSDGRILGFGHVWPAGRQDGMCFRPTPKQSTNRLSRVAGAVDERSLFAAWLAIMAPSPAAAVIVSRTCCSVNDWPMRRSISAIFSVLHLK